MKKVEKADLVEEFAQPIESRAKAVERFMRILAK